MAELSKDHFCDHWSAQFPRPSGKHEEVVLGSQYKKGASQLGPLAEDLVAMCNKERRQPFTPGRRDNEPAANNHENPHGKCINEISDRTVAPTLSEWLEKCIEKRPDLAPSSRFHYRVAGRDLLKFFGVNTRITQIGPTDAKKFRAWLSTARKLSEVTVNLHCRRAKQFFGAAVSHELLAENPFEAIPCSKCTNPERLYFVTREETEAVMEVLPTLEWQVLFALCRYGGLRCPSEVFQLRLKDIDWSRARFTVHGPKLERRLPGGPRQVPLFPELLPYLRAVYQKAKTDEAYVVAPSGCVTKNPASYLRYAVTRAGLKPWPRITQNLRSSRETELAEDYPLHVVAAWMGHTRRVAIKHYLQVTDAHYEKAAEGAQLGLQKAQMNSVLPKTLTDAWGTLPESVKATILKITDTPSSSVS